MPMHNFLSKENIVVGIDCLCLLEENVPYQAEEDTHEKPTRCTELADALPDRGTNKKE